MSKPVVAILGTRIRERRRRLLITQAELARRIGISASYLNLIEHNKRGIAGALLRRTADALDLELGELDGAAERRLLEQLQDIAHQPEVKALGVELERAGEFIGRFPGWARALGALSRSEREATDVARALSDRLTHDPFLGETVHRILTQVASVRSAAEILDEYNDLSGEELARFQGIIHKESRTLTDVVEALARYFDQAGAADHKLTPVDEVESLFEANDNHFAIIEAATEHLAGALKSPYITARRTHALELAEQHAENAITNALADGAGLQTQLAQAKARQALTEYAAAAIAAPMTEFVIAADACGYDAEMLADQFGMEVRTACERLAAMPITQGRPRFGYLRANAAGTLVAMRGLPGLVVPRYGFACPLWVLYRAQQSPERMLRQRTVFPSGARFVFVAEARSAQPRRFAGARHYLTDMLALTESDAMMTVYAPPEDEPVEPVGTACRSCARRKCAHRVADPLAG